MIGRAVADLPMQIGVEIRRTPTQGAAYDDIFELIANVDRAYFMLGRDITAPAGTEWYLGWKLERSIMPMVCGCTAHAGSPGVCSQFPWRVDTFPFAARVGAHRDPRFGADSQPPDQSLWVECA